MPKVSSREYKLMLKPARFAGNALATERAASTFWQVFSDEMVELVIGTKKLPPNVIRTHRIRFYDTSTCLLRRQGYVFRERVITSENPSLREGTLKFRHPDRYISQDRDMKTKRGRSKFEEDLKPTFTCDYPFHTLFSYSTTRALSKKLTLGKLKHLFHLFPDLKRQLKAHPRSEPLTAVGGFTAYEQVILGPSLQIRKSPKASAECALILWHAEDEQTPLKVEVSFRYKDEKARFSQKMVRRANEVYSSLQESKLLAKWVDPGSSTKTAYVYSLVDC